MRPNAWDDDYDTRGKRIAVIGTGSSGVQIAAALSAQAKTLFVYQRTPGWVLPKIDFDIPTLGAQGVPAARFHHGGQRARPGVDGRFMVVPIVHMLPRLPDTALVRVMPLYDKWSRLLYRLLLRATVDNPAYRRALRAPDRHHGQTPRSSPAHSSRRSTARTPP